MLKYWWNKKLQKPCNNVFIIISQGQVANCDLWIIRSPLGMFLISPSGFPQPCPSRSSKSVCQWRRREPASWSAAVDIDPAVSQLLLQEMRGGEGGVIPCSSKWMSRFLQETVAQPVGQRWVPQLIVPAHYGRKDADVRYEWLLRLTRLHYKWCLSRAGGCSVLSAESIKLVNGYFCYWTTALAVFFPIFFPHDSCFECFL